MDSRDYLRSNLTREFGQYYGIDDENYIDCVADAWMNDKDNSEHRFEVIRKHLPAASRILDMASGCGTFVFYGLLHGYDVLGIEPEKWKNSFNRMKAIERGYPEEWKDRFVEARGESLPFGDDYFDFVSTYQTLEHVENPTRCIKEMLRVTRQGGAVHIRCPDYRSTYEGHYRLPWLPLMPQFIARVYLRIIGKLLEGLGGLNYVTGPRIRNSVCRLAKERGYTLTLVNLRRAYFDEQLKARRPKMVSMGGVLYPLYGLYEYLKTLLRSEWDIDLLVILEKK